MLIELVNEFNEPVLISIESTRFFVLRVVVATELDKEPILEFNPLVVVAILELNPLVVVATLELNPLVVVATLELKESILDDKPLVVVATDEDKEPILVDILELNVE